MGYIYRCLPFYKLKLRNFKKYLLVYNNSTSLYVNINHTFFNEKTTMFSKTKKSSGKSGIVLLFLQISVMSFFFLVLFIYFWLHWVFVAACRLSLVVVSGRLLSSLWCVGFSLWWLLLLRSTGSRACASVVVALGLSSCGSRALEHRLSSCGARAQLFHGM